MRKRTVSELLTLSLLSMFLFNILPVWAIDTLEPSDFELESWSKNIDFMDYVREFTSEHNMTQPAEDSHAHLNLNYVNVSGLQMLYAGLSNITDDKGTLTIPIQTFMMHYKSSDGAKDVLTASSFIMMFAFNETGETIFPDSPDMNDTLYASFSLGYDLKKFYGEAQPPALNSKTEIIPLSSSPDKLNWTWGMRYINLTAIWWNTSIDPEKPKYDIRPIAVSRYNELTFTYELIINPESGEATLNMNYTIGKMEDLWVFWWLIVLPIGVHYNSTGCYRLNGDKINDETIHDFLNSQGIKMSIVQFQSTVVLDHTAYFSSSGANVTDNEVFVSDSEVATTTEDGEEVFSADFASKKEYKLFDGEGGFETYNTTTRTCKIAGFARNPIFGVHTGLMRFIPHIVAAMNPELYEQARDHLLDMNYSDFFYVISYPTYGGYLIEHDPTYKAYAALTSDEAFPSPTPSAGSQSFPSAALFVVIGLVAAVVVLIVAMLRRKR